MQKSQYLLPPWYKSNILSKFPTLKAEVNCARNWKYGLESEREKDYFSYVARAGNGRYEYLCEVDSIPSSKSSSFPNICSRFVSRRRWKTVTN